MTRTTRKLSKEQDEILTAFAQEKGLIEYINSYLEENGLAELEVDYVQIKEKEIGFREGKCREGYKEVIICNNGRCQPKCKKLPKTK